ncbi:MULTISPECIES: hypothetical protein [Pseudomonas]
MTLSSHFTPWASLFGGALIGLSAGLFILAMGAGMLFFEGADSRRSAKA